MLLRAGGVRGTLPTLAVRGERLLMGHILCQWFTLVTLSYVTGNPIHLRLSGMTRIWCGSSGLMVIVLAQALKYYPGSVHLRVLGLLLLTSSVGIRPVFGVVDQCTCCLQFTPGPRVCSCVASIRHGMVGQALRFGSCGTYVLPCVAHPSALFVAVVSSTRPGILGGSLVCVGWTCTGLFHRVYSLGSYAGASAVRPLAHLSREGATASLWRTGLWQQGEVLQAPAGMSHSLIRCAGAPAM